jgi:hypothetical protein
MLSLPRIIISKIGKTHAYYVRPYVRIPAWTNADSSLYPLLPLPLPVWIACRHLTIYSNVDTSMFKARQKPVLMLLLPVITEWRWMIINNVYFNNNNNNNNNNYYYYYSIIVLLIDRMTSCMFCIYLTLN